MGDWISTPNLNLEIFDEFTDIESTACIDLFTDLVESQMSNMTKIDNFAGNVVLGGGSGGDNLLFNNHLQAVVVDVTGVHGIRWDAAAQNFKIYNSATHVWDVAVIGSSGINITPHTGASVTDVNGIHGIRWDTISQNFKILNPSTLVWETVSVGGGGSGDITAHTETLVVDVNGVHGILWDSVNQNFKVYNPATHVWNTVAVGGGDQTVVLTTMELSVLESPASSGKYPSLVGKIVIIKDEQPSGGSGSISVGGMTRYTCIFNATTDWTYDSPNTLYYISIPKTTHNINHDIDVSLWIVNNGEYIKTFSFPSSHLWVSDNNGDITLYSEDRFVGKLVISGFVE